MNGIIGSQWLGRHFTKGRPRRKRAVAAVVALGLVAGACTSDGDSGRPGPDSEINESVDSAESTSPSELDGRERSTISYRDARGWMDDLGQSDRLAQLSDWAAYGFASMLDLPTDVFQGFLYDKVAVRDPLFAGMGERRAGLARSVPDGEGTLHLLVPDGALSQSRDIAGLIDDHRVETGTDPDWVVVHTFAVDDQASEIVIEHGGRIEAADTRQRHGFVEMEIGTAAQLQEFLNRTQHLAGIDVRDGTLWASGWQWDGVPSAPITIDDFAVLRASYVGSNDDGPGFSLDPADSIDEFDLLEAVVPEAEPWLFDALVAALLVSNTPEADLESQFAEAYDLDDADTIAELIGYGTAILVEIEAGLFGDTTELAAAAESLEIEADRSKFWALSNFVDADPLASVARYDGGLEGTEVGMTLFYTDLIAKDWTTGVGNAVPSDNGIDDFVTEANLGTNWSHCPSGQESGRLWLGLDSGAVAAAGDGVDFGSISTRLFSRSDDDRGGEVERSYHFGAALQWWDEHYRDVADYEPQYHRLDQIMRWSTALAWASSSGVDTPDVVEANRSLRYEDWSAGRSDLRENARPNFIFVTGDDREFVAPEPSQPFEKCGQDFVSGGVSLTRRSVVGELRRASSDVPSLFRRRGSVVNGTNPSAGRFATGYLDDAGNVVNRVDRTVGIVDDGVTVDVTAFSKSVNNLGKVNITGLSGQTRSVRVAHKAVSDGIETAVTAQGAELGTAAAIRTPTGASIRWTPGPVDRFRRFIARLQDAIRPGATNGSRPIGRAVDDIDGLFDFRTGTDRFAFIDDDVFRIASTADDGPLTAQVTLDGSGNRVFVSRVDQGPTLPRGAIDSTGARSLTQLDTPASRSRLATLDDAFESNTTLYQPVVNEGQIPITGLDRGTRVRVTEYTVSSQTAPDLALTRAGSVFESVKVGTGLTTTIAIVECDIDPADGCTEASDDSEDETQIVTDGNVAPTTAVTAIAYRAEPGRGALEIGHEGPRVRALQQALVAAGYLTAGDVDGSFGPTTLDAVRGLQRAGGLEVDGLAGPHVHDRLSITYAAPGGTDEQSAGGTAGVQYGPEPSVGVLQIGHEGPRVRAVQQALSARGFLDASGVDGEFGPGTKSSLEAFQRSVNLTADGVAGPDVHRQLGLSYP